MLEKLVVLVCFYGLTTCYADDLFVTLPNGLVQGYQLLTPSNITFSAFQGIPYAKPPVGDLRFSAPEEPDSWQGTLSATAERDTCYQPSVDDEPESEDCLYLNVYTPLLSNFTNATQLPVILWIFGGGFVFGSSRNAGPDFFIEKDIVFVSFNYRIGPFGFLSTGDKTLSGNAGLKDQLLALKWVRKNIHLFGGNPDQITLANAGASIGYHLLSKQATGLFRGAILQSGTSLVSWAYNPNPLSDGLALARTLNQGDFTSNPAGLVAALRNVSAEDLDAASLTQLRRGILHLPVLELATVTDPFITEPMYELFAAGDYNQVPVLIGITSEPEIDDANNLVALNASYTAARNNVSLLVPSDLNLDSAASIAAIGQMVESMYFDGVEEKDALGMYIRWKSDNLYVRPTVRHAHMASYFDGGKAYFYQFSYRGLIGCGTSNITINGTEGIVKGAESYYVSKFQFKDCDNSDLSVFPEADILTHNRMVTLYSNFVKYLNPTPTKDSLLQDLTWSPVESLNFQYLNINTTLEMVQAFPNNETYVAWKSIYDNFGLRPFTTY